VYNRIILENAVVRAAAVTALTKFAARLSTLRPSVLVLLRRSLRDEDDEVRDRATLALRLLGDELRCIVPSIDENQTHTGESLPSATGQETQLLLEPLMMPFSKLARALEKFELTEDQEASQALTMATLPIVEDTRPVPAAHVCTKTSLDSTSTHEDLVSELYKVPELAALGSVCQSTLPIELTESETEYKVTCVKHIYQNVEEDSQHIVFQFNMTNTLNDQILENVRVLLDEIDESDCILVPAAQMAYDVPCVAYTAIALDSQDTDQTYTCNLDFIVKDCDPETGDVDDEGYPDSYALEDLDVSMADMMQPVDKPNFGAAWEELSDAHSAEETYELSSMTGIEDAVTKISAHLGMRACEKSDKVKSGKSTHSLYLAGVYAGGH
jgi:coatomer protein complex subunit gamma